MCSLRKNKDVDRLVYPWQYASIWTGNKDSEDIELIKLQKPQTE